MTDRVGGEGPAPHTPQQQQLYADPYALSTSGPALSCSVCDSPWSIVPLMNVWHDNKRDSLCERCFAWMGSVLHTVKLQRMYT